MSTPGQGLGNNAHYQPRASLLKSHRLPCSRVRLYDVKTRSPWSVSWIASCSRPRYQLHWPPESTYRNKRFPPLICGQDHFRLPRTADWLGTLQQPVDFTVTAHSTCWREHLIEERVLTDIRGWGSGTGWHSSVSFEDGSHATLPFGSRSFGSLYCQSHLCHLSEPSSYPT